MRVLLLAALLLPHAALAQVDAQARSNAHRWEPLGLLLEAGELSGSAAGRTIRIDNPRGGYATAVLVVDRTRSAGTDLTMTCVSAIAAGAPAAVRGTCAYDSNGVCTFKPATWKAVTSASEVLEVRVDVLGRVRTDCTFASTSADGDDEVTVTGILVTQ